MSNLFTVADSPWLISERLPLIAPMKALFLMTQAKQRETEKQNKKITSDLITSLLFTSGHEIAVQLADGSYLQLIVGCCTSMLITWLTHVNGYGGISSFVVSSRNSGLYTSYL